MEIEGVCRGVSWLEPRRERVGGGPRICGERERRQSLWVSGRSDVPVASRRAKCPRDLMQKTHCDILNVLSRRSTTRKTEGTPCLSFAKRRGRRFSHVASLRQDRGGHSREGLGDMSMDWGENIHTRLPNRRLGNILDGGGVGNQAQEARARNNYGGVLFPSKGKHTPSNAIFAKRSSFATD